MSHLIDNKEALGPDEKVHLDGGGRQSVISADKLEAGADGDHPHDLDRPHKGNAKETWFFDQSAQDGVKRRLHQRHVQMYVQFRKYAIAHSFAGSQLGLPYVYYYAFAC